MVLVHEFGHFAAAKLCGVRVESFAIGFGKRLLGFVHNGTDYRLNLLPLGGYVKMAGEMGPTGEEQVLTNDPGELQNHPRWQRTLIAVAGPVANFILAILLMTFVFMAHNEVPQYLTQPVVADYVTPDSPMNRTGILPGDKVVSYDGQAMPDWRMMEVRSQVSLNHSAEFAYLHNGQRMETSIFVESKGKPEDFDIASLGLLPRMQDGPLVVSSLASADSPAVRAGLTPGDQILAVDQVQPHSIATFSTYLQDTKGKPVTLQVNHKLADGAFTPEKLTITPEVADTQFGKRYQIGFTGAQPPVVVEHYSFLKALDESWKENKKNSLLVKDVIQRLFTHEVSIKSMSSPIGIGVQVHQAFKMGGWLPITELMAMISLQLGIFNLLPIPILDGGMIAMLAVESVIRRDLSLQLKERLYQVAFVCIVLFAAVVIFNDITKLVPVPHIRS